LANSQKHVVIAYIASNLLDTGLAIFLESIESESS